jgi:protein-tyrosine phosphatase
VNNIGPMSLSAIDALKKLGMQPAAEWARFPMQATIEELEKANLVIALKQAEHWPLLQERYLGWAEKLEYWHIEDEPGVLALVEHQVNQLVNRLRITYKFRAST